MSKLSINHHTGAAEWGSSLLSLGNWKALWSMRSHKNSNLYIALGKGTTVKSWVTQPLKLYHLKICNHSWTFLQKSIFMAIFGFDPQCPAYLFSFFSCGNCFSKCRHATHVNSRPSVLFLHLLYSVTRTRFICALKFGILSNYWSIPLGNRRAHPHSTLLHLPYEDHLIYIIDSSPHLKWDASYGARASGVDCFVVG